MTRFCKYDIVVVKFPFVSSLKYKARPAVVVSTDKFNQSSRNTLLILAISSQINTKLELGSLKEEDIRLLDLQLQKMCQ